MTQHRHLSEDERATLERLVEEYGLKFVAEHTGVSTRVIQQALRSSGHHLSMGNYERIAGYIHARI